MDSVLTSFLGLPTHPLVVHAAVVLLPLSALSLVVVVVWRWWRERFAGLSLAGLTVSVGTALLAKESGERLADIVGKPEEHADLTDILVPVTIVTWGVAVLWFVLRRRAGSPSAGLPAMISGIVMALGAVAVTVLVGLVGHSGAQAAWGDIAASGQGGARPGQQATQTTSTQSADSTTTTYTMAQVAEHNDATSCWTAIGGEVYDVTQWISRHPGGAERIEGLCGTNGTGAFTGKHGEPRACTASPPDLGGP